METVKEVIQEVTRGDKTRGDMRRQEETGGEETGEEEIGEEGDEKKMRGYGALTETVEVGGVAG